MFSESWAKEDGRNNTLFAGFSKKSNSEVYRYYIINTKHFDFTDIPAFSPLAPYLGLKGSLGGEKVSKIINAYTVAFFGNYFKDEQNILLDNPSDEFPELIHFD